jgi:16S rRNA C967 or C1407 C5-methylase (RsmB/RsmF family)/NOL1/NOP2/fmu family ribosome biogenesis protein
LNIPPSLLADLQGISGFDETAFINVHLTDPVVSVRTHPVKGQNQFLNEETVPWSTTGRYLPARPVFTLDPSYHAGAYYVQEASSMFLEQMLKVIFAEKKGLRVLDLCAAPGGKSTLIAALLDRESLLISNEVIRARASILEENMSRWGYMNTWVTSNDPRDLGRLEGYFDVIVVDAPCSGSGLWRKDAAALNEWSENNVQLCSARQQRILTDVWPALKKGGTLVYATCSYSPQEDEAIMDQLATDFDITGIEVALEQSWGIEQTYSPLKKIPDYRFFPYKAKGEGFFIAAVVKNDPAKNLTIAKFKSAINSKIQDQARYLLSPEDTIFLPGKENSFNAILRSHEADLQLLPKFVYLRKTGLDAGTPVAKEWLPGHDIALAVDIHGELPFIDANREQALKFLKREEMGIENVPKGWHVVKYNGNGLGWVKALGNRMNNYLPKQWRIRMDIDA